MTKFRIQAAVILTPFVVVAALFLWPYRPSDARILQRHLGLTNTSEFTRTQVAYASGREWTAWVYLEGSTEAIRRVLSEQQFTARPWRESQWAAHFSSFTKAPPIPTGSGCEYFLRRRTGIMDYAITSPGSTQLWFVALKY